MKKTGIIIFILGYFTLFGQDETVENRCGKYNHRILTKTQTDSLKALFSKKYPQKTQNKNGKRTESIFRIPVVFHVIHNNANGEIGVGSNISDAQIKSQIEVLNQDYGRKPGTRGFNSSTVGADMEIEFFLATTDDNCMATKAITRHYYQPKAVFDPNNDEILIKSFGYWPSDKYLNIWVTSLSGGILGISPFPNNTSLSGLSDFEVQPELNGPIINHKTVGNRIGTSAVGSDSYAYGRTATHEIGHWLGLFHPWGSGIGCDTDYCDDTPESNGGNQTKNNCADKFSNCNNNGPVRVMIENYMDYSEDKCMNIFTQDQKARMRTTLTNSPERAALVSSPGHTQQIISTDFPPQNFNSINAISEINWTQSSSISSITGWKLETTGTNQKNILVENNSSTIGNKSILQTIFYDLPTTSGNNLAVIDIDVTYPEVSDTDSLIISIYTGCKTQPIIIKTITEADLRSNNLPKNHIITIPKLPINLDYLKLQFENRSRGKADLRVDNIKINKPFTGSTKLDAKILYDASLNPQKVLVYATDSANLRFEIIDILGKKYAEYTQLFNYLGEYELPNLNLEKGMYFLRIHTANSSISNRFIISN